MTETAKTAQIDAAISALRASGVVPAVAQALMDSAGAITRDLQEAVVREVPAFTVTGNPDVLPELRQDLERHVEAVYCLLAGRRPGDLSFVRTHAQRRAEQKFPLDAVMKENRCAHKIMSQSIRDAALQADD